MKTEKIISNNPDKKFRKYQLWFPFLIFPCYLLLCSCIVIQEFFITLFRALPNTFIMFLLLLLLCILAVGLLHLFQKSQTARANYRHLARLGALQEAHYHEVAEKRRELDKLRGEFEGQLESICSRLQDKNYPEAMKQLSALTRRVEATSEYPFCPNAVINSVLTNARTRCEELSISFQAELLIGDCAAVNKLHLCNIFSNLLDNAVAACGALPEGLPRSILVHARQEADYLHIRVVNTAPVDSTAPPKSDRHGYGQKILRDIAAAYDGEFRAGPADGVYEAFLSLRIPQASAPSC